MKKRFDRSLLTGLFVLSIAPFWGCTESNVEPGASASPGAKPIVYVPVPPYEFVFDRIAGDLIDLRTIVGPGGDPHSYTPSPKQIADLGKANLICSGELGFESNYFIGLGDGTNGPKGLNLLAGLELLEGHCDHPSHLTETTEDDHDHDHDHEDLNDPHVWLSPTVLAIQGDHIAALLKETLPGEKAAEIDANLAAFKEELVAIHAELSASLESHQGMKFYVYHGAFAYFARDYGLEQVAIEIGNRRPEPQQLAEIVKQAKADNVKLIFVQPQFDQSSADAIAESIGGKVAFLDPLEKDIFANLRSIAKAITGDPE